jgi:ABC-2 type transport system ATP-binding protein
VSAPAISASGPSKDYGSGRGLFELDLEVRQGEVFGFLGPNGAGKSTTMRLLLDLIKPTSGSAQVLGLDTVKDSSRSVAGSAFCPATSPCIRD